MATSKSQQIVDAAYALLSGLSGYTQFKGKRTFADHELPAVALYRSEFRRSTDTNQRTRIDGAIVLEAHKLAAPSGAASYAPSDLGEAMIYALRTLMEVEAGRTLGGLLIGPGLVLEAHEIQYPDAADGVISIRLEYSCPHVERHGSP